MTSRSTFGIHGTISAVLAAAIVGTSGLAFDRGHGGAAKAAPAAPTAETARLDPADALPRVALLPEIVVTARRLDTFARAEA